MTSSTNKVTLAQRLRSLIAGTQKHLSNGQLTLGGVAYTEVTIVQTLQRLVDLLTKVDVARGGWKDALKEMRDERAKVDPFVRAYRSMLVNMFSNAPATLAEFGIELKPRTPMTADAKSLAAARRKATRDKRHTMGKKQKQGAQSWV